MTAKRDTVADRMKEARFQTAAQKRQAVSQAQMAAFVSAAAGRAVHQTQWGRYESGESEPPLDVIVATAMVSGLPEGYIAFGGERPAYVYPPELPKQPAEVVTQAGKKGKGKKAG